MSEKTLNELYPTGENVPAEDNTASTVTRMGAGAAGAALGAKLGSKLGTTGALVGGGIGFGAGYGLGSSADFLFNQTSEEIGKLDELYPTQGPTVTPGKAIKETALGAAEGAVTAGPVVAGGMAGARLGMAAGAPFTPVFPAAVPVGGVIGLGAGMASGYLAGKEFGKLFPEVTSPSLVPYREGGKTFGESIAFAPAAFGLPVMTGNKVARFISNIGEFARKSPKTFLSAEASAAAGAGIGGGMAEAYAPGEAGIRLASEVVGGLFNPTRIGVGAGSYALDTVKNLSSRLSPASRESIAANRLVTIMEQYGEDIPRLIKELESPSLVSGATAAQKTGSIPLTLLEKSLVDSSARFGVTTREKGEAAMKAYSKIVKELENIGNPESIRTAAQLRQNYFDKLLQSRIETANANAAAKISKITRDTATARKEIGEITKQEVNKALTQAREEESNLWKNISKSTTLTPPTNTLKAYAEIQDDIAVEQLKYDFPAGIKAMMARFEKTKDSLTVGDLVKARRFLLNDARKAAGSDDLATAQFLGRLDRAMLQDLDEIQTTDSAYNTARAFSRALNERFTQTFAQDLTGKTRTGAQRVPPEVLVAKAFSAGSDMTALRMSEMENAVQLFPDLYAQAVKQYGPESPQALRLKTLADESSTGITTMRKAQDRMLRLAAAESIDPQTGMLNQGRLARFMKDYEPLLARFPEVAEDLKDANKAQNLFKAVEDKNSVVAKRVAEQDAFVRLLKFENPSEAIGSVLNSKFPARGMDRIVRRAKRAGPEAVNGLKSSLYDYAYLKAGGDTNFSLRAYNNALFDPIGPGKPSIAGMLKNQGLISPQEESNLRRILGEMDRVETALVNNKALDSALDASDIVTEFVLRTTGARIGASVSAGPSTLVAASAGSQAIRNIFDKMPKIMIRGILEEASANPQMMAALLKKGKTTQDKVTLARQLHGYLGAAGLNYLEQDEERPSVVMKPTPPTTPPGTTARQMFNQTNQLPTAPQQPQPVVKKQPPAPASRGFNLQQPTGGAPAPAAGAPTGGNAMEMYQRLFPNDKIMR